MDPKSKTIKHGQNATEELSSRNSDLNQPDNPTDKSMESSAERKADLVSDPNYPSFEILLDVAGKLLDAFDKHWQKPLWVSVNVAEDRLGPVEPIEPASEDRLDPFCRVYLDFLLRRVVHDLGNSISGINSLSDYHLRSGISDPGLEESLRMIRESAEQSRELLMAVGDLVQPAETEAELVEVQMLIEEAAKMLSLLLPRSIKLETTGLERNNAIISVLRGDFLRKILALVAMDVGSLRIPTGTIRLGCAREGDSVRVDYRSMVGSASRLRERAPELLRNLSSSVEVRGSVEGDALVLTMTFPLVTLFEGQG